MHRRRSSGEGSAAPPKRPTAASTNSFARRSRGVKPGKMIAVTSVENATLAVSENSFAGKKLAYDELLRHQRSRAEDTAKLLAHTARGYLEKKNESALLRKMAGFREEWRIGREDEILERLRSEEHQTSRSNNADEMEDSALREHFKRSIHTFLTTELARMSINDAAGAVQTKRSHDLLYAQQMDRVLGEIDTKRPFEVMLQAIKDARACFRALQAQQSIEIQEPSKPDPIQSISSSDSVQENPASQPELLQLYENVMDAKCAVTHTTFGTKRSVAAEVASANFLVDLQKQRADAEHQQNEIAAKAHYRHVSARRAQQCYRKYRARERHRHLVETLQRIRKSCAIRLLQLRIPPMFRQHSAIRSFELALKRKNQATRIATFCFWRFVYRKRCGFDNFRFDRTVDDLLTNAVIRIQSFARQLKARRHLQLLRLIQTLKHRRANVRKWQTLQAFGQVRFLPACEVAAAALLDTLGMTDCVENMQRTRHIDADLVEWHCRIAVEKTRAQEEVRREELRFASEWKRYEVKLQKEVLKSKIPPEWIPQLDPVSGEEFFLNAKTAKISKENPNKVLAAQLIEKQRIRAHTILAEQIQRIETYERRLDTHLREHTEHALEEVLAVWIRLHQQGVDILQPAQRMCPK